MKDSIDLALEMVKAKLKAAGSASFASFRRLYEARLDIICNRNAAVANVAMPQSFISADFTEFRLGPHSYVFSPRQAQIVDFMLRCLLNGARHVTSARIAEEIGRPGSFKMAVAFQKSDAWRKLIRPTKMKGAYTLVLTGQEIEQAKIIVEMIDRSEGA